jgi:hypothetical protein
VILRPTTKVVNNPGDPLRPPARAERERSREIEEGEPRAEREIQLASPRAAPKQQKAV